MLEKYTLNVVFLQGAVSLVTGGASGLGKATVERLVQQGSKVVVCDLPSSKGNELVKTVGEDKAIFAPVNVSRTPSFNHSIKKLDSNLQVTSEQDVTDAIKLTKEKFGKLSYLVNCAGIGAAVKTYNFKKNQPHSLEEFAKVVTVSIQ